MGTVSFLEPVDLTRFARNPQQEICDKAVVFVSKSAAVYPPEYLSTISSSRPPAKGTELNVRTRVTLERSGYFLATRKSPSRIPTTRFTSATSIGYRKWKALDLFHLIAIQAPGYLKAMPSKGRIIILYN